MAQAAHSRKESKESTSRTNSKIEYGAVKVIELVGISRDSFDDAVTQAVKKASQTLDDIRGVQVENFSAKVENGAIYEYHANVKVAFPVR